MRLKMTKLPDGPRCPFAKMKQNKTETMEEKKVEWPVSKTGKQSEQTTHRSSSSDSQ